MWGVLGGITAHRVCTHRRENQFKHLKWLNPSTRPAPQSDQWQQFGNTHMEHLISHWDKFLWETCAHARPTKMMSLWTPFGARTKNVL